MRSCGKKDLHRWCLITTIKQKVIIQEKERLVNWMICLECALYFYILCTKTGFIACEFSLCAIVVVVISVFVVVIWTFSLCIDFNLIAIASTTNGGSGYHPKAANKKCETYVAAIKNAGTHFSSKIIFAFSIN